MAIARRLVLTIASRAKNLANVALNSVQSVQPHNEPQFQRAKTTSKRNAKMLNNPATKQNMKQPLFLSHTMQCNGNSQKMNVHYKNPSNFRANYVQL